MIPVLYPTPVCLSVERREIEAFVALDRIGQDPRHLGIGFTYARITNRRSRVPRLILVELPVPGPGIHTPVRVPGTGVSPRPYGVKSFAFWFGESSLPGAWFEQRARLHTPASGTDRQWWSVETQPRPS